MSRLRLLSCLLASILVLYVADGQAEAVQNPQSGSTGLQGTISSPAPTVAATITTPSPGRTYTATPIQVAGLCTGDLLVKVFVNNIFVGSTFCSKNSYSLQIDLFNGQNNLVARVYDALDQAGPDSNVVTVTFNDPGVATSGSRVSLTSSYAKRGANPGDTLTWPIVLSGGKGPYAISVDWGDSKPAELKSVAFPGAIDIVHIYASAGIYHVIVKATDADGVTAYLQLVGVANGAIAQANTDNNSNGKITIVETHTEWWPAFLTLPLVLATFWIGRRSELFTLRKRIDQTLHNDPK